MNEDTKTILVVDDDKNVGLLVSVILKNLNYDVITLLTGSELLSYLIKHSKPSLILLDLKLPDIDGYELCKKIRENPNLGDIPIIILTGVSEVDSRIKVIDMGADDYINKPFDVREFKVRIKRILKRKENDSSLNPLTKLPGGPIIEEHTKKRIETNPDFAFEYIDIDNFKAYNDVYGYSKGDNIIKFLAKIIIDSIKSFSPTDYFVGHVGGDDFVVIVPNNKSTKITEEIISKFDKEILQYYNEEHRRLGYITSVDRMNNKKTYPIMTLSIAIVNVTKPMHYAKIIEKVFEIKRFIKSRPTKNKSIYHRDRRTNEWWTS